MNGMEPPVSGLHDYNPRCVRRDLNHHVSKKFFTTANLLNITIGNASKSIKLFQDELNGRPQDNGFMGMRG
jgi:tyrosinase